MDSYEEEPCEKQAQMAMTLLRLCGLKHVGTLLRDDFKRCEAAVHTRRPSMCTTSALPCHCRCAASASPPSTVPACRWAQNMAFICKATMELSAEDSDKVSRGEEYVRKLQDRCVLGGCASRACQHAPPPASGLFLHVACNTSCLGLLTCKPTCTAQLCWVLLRVW